MSRISLTSLGRKGSGPGQDAKFRPTFRDGNSGAGNGPSNRNIGFVTDSVGYTPEGRTGASGQFSSDFDPGCVKTPAVALQAQHLNRKSGLGESLMRQKSVLRINLALEGPPQEFLHSQDPKQPYWIAPALIFRTLPICTDFSAREFTRSWAWT